jgi:hypothetical protein
MYPRVLSTRTGTRLNTRGRRIFKGGEKTTPKLANLSPILVYFSVIPFSPVTTDTPPLQDRFIFNVTPFLFFSIFFFQRRSLVPRPIADH